MFYSNLRAFEETARAHSIRKASQALGVAPSSVSRSIAVLEREMGTRLLERRSGGVELTHAGTLVAAYARSVLLEYESLRADLDDMRGTQRKLVRLALVGSVASHGPMNAVASLARRFPGTSFDVHVSSAPEVFRTVLQDRCDVGAAYCAEPNPDILTLASIPEPVVVAMNPRNALTRLRAIELAELANIPFAISDRDSAVRQMFDRTAGSLVARLAPVLTSNDFGTLLGFARENLGVSILPMRSAADEVAAGRIRTIPLSGTAFRDATIDIIVLRKRRLPRVVRAFVDVLIAEIRAAV